MRTAKSQRTLAFMTFLWTMLSLTIASVPDFDRVGYIRVAVELESVGKEKPSFQHSLITLEKIHLVGEDRSPEAKKESSKSIAWISTEERSWRANTNHEFVVSLKDTSKGTQWLVVLSAVKESGDIQSLQTRMLSIEPQKPVVVVQLKMQLPNISPRRELPIWQIMIALTIGALFTLGKLHIKRTDVKENEEVTTNETHTSANALAAETENVQSELPATQPDLSQSSKVTEAAKQAESPVKASPNLARTPTNDYSSNDDSGTELSRQLENEQDSEGDEEDWCKPPKIRRNKVSATHAVPICARSSYLPFPELDGFQDDQPNSGSQTCRSVFSEVPTSNINRLYNQFPGTRGTAFRNYPDSPRINSAHFGNSTLRPALLSANRTPIQKNLRSGFNHPAHAASTQPFGESVKGRLGAIHVHSEQETVAMRPLSLAGTNHGREGRDNYHSTNPGEPVNFQNSTYSSKLPPMRGGESLSKTKPFGIQPMENDKGTRRIAAMPKMDRPEPITTRTFGDSFGKGFATKPLSGTKKSLPKLGKSHIFGETSVDKASCSFAGLTITSGQCNSFAQDRSSNEPSSGHPAASDQTTHRDSGLCSDSSTTPLSAVAGSCLDHSFTKAIDEPLPPKTTDFALDPTDVPVNGVDRNNVEAESEGDGLLIDHRQSKPVIASCDNKVDPKTTFSPHACDVHVQNKLQQANDESCPIATETELPTILVQHSSICDPKDTRNGNLLLGKASSGGQATPTIAVVETENSGGVSAENSKIKSDYDLSHRDSSISRDSPTSLSPCDGNSDMTNRSTKHMVDSEVGKGHDSSSAHLYVGASCTELQQESFAGASADTKASQSKTPQFGFSSADQQVIQQPKGKCLPKDRTAGATLSSQQSKDLGHCLSTSGPASVSPSYRNNIAAVSKNCCTNKQPLAAAGVVDSSPANDKSACSTALPSGCIRSKSRSDSIAQDHGLDDRKDNPKLLVDEKKCTDQPIQGILPSKKAASSTTISKANCTEDKTEIEPGFTCVHETVGSDKSSLNSNRSRNSPPQKERFPGPRRFGASGVLKGVQHAAPTRTKRFATDISTCSTLPPHSDCTPTPESMANARPPKLSFRQNMDFDDEEDLEFDSNDSSIQKSDKRRPGWDTDHQNHGINKTLRYRANKGKKQKATRSRDPIPEVPVSASLRAIHEAEIADDRMTALRNKRKKGAIPRTIEILDDSNSLVSKDSAVVLKKKRKLSPTIEQTKLPKKDKMPFT